MTTFVYRDGSRLTPYMLYQIERLNRDLKKLFGVECFVSSGIRLYHEQEAIFLDRYVTRDKINGRHVYDTRIWKGVRYYRISPKGTVVPPGSIYSFHEIRGTDGAVDLRDSGTNAGIAVAGSTRSNWLRANCHKYDMVAEGFAFGEAWHYKMRNIFNSVPKPPPPPPSGGGSTAKETRVLKTYRSEDATARKVGRTLSRGMAFWLNKLTGQSTSKASNVVGGVGPYIFAVHVYVKGTPGDAVDVRLYWDNTKTSGAHSPHYLERVFIGDTGDARHTVSFMRAVPSGYAVYANCKAEARNKGSVTVTLFDVDAYQFST